MIFDQHCSIGLKSGGLYGSWTLAEEYGFTDVNGERPNWWAYFSKNFPRMVNAKPNTGFRWRLERDAERPAAKKRRGKAAGSK